MISAPASLASLALALLSTAIGQMLFKMYYLRTNKQYLIAAMITFLAVPLFSYLALLNLTLAFVYMSTAMIHVLVLAMSHYFLDEVLTRKHYVSMSLIILGIITFNY